MTVRRAALVLVGLLIVAGAILLALTLSSRARARAQPRPPDMEFRPDAMGRYPNEPGYLDPDA